MSDPLVSIVIISYNAERYIIECLNSISRQLYDNIEVIVSDDCSDDNTLNLINEWYDLNQCFSRFVVVQTDSNRGVSANCNRGLEEAKGVWVKYIAADDFLDNPYSISTYVKYASRFSNCSAIFSNVKLLIENDVFDINTPPEYNLVFNSVATAKDQYNLLSKKNVLYAPSAFIKVDTIRLLGGWDERIPMCEDIPMWLKLTYNGYRLYYIDFPLVVYRRSAATSSLVNRYKSFDEQMIRQYIIIYEQYRMNGQTKLIRGLFLLYCQYLNFICSISSKHPHWARTLFHIYRIVNKIICSVYFVVYRKKFLLSDTE